MNIVCCASTSTLRAGRTERRTPPSLPRRRDRASGDESEVRRRLLAGIPGQFVADLLPVVQSADPGVLDGGDMNETGPDAILGQIGRASGRERGCQEVKISVGAVALKK